MRRTKTFLDVVLSFSPKFWLQNNDYCQVWDERLQRLLRDERFVYSSQHAALLGGVEVHIENYPYACFAPQKAWGIRPSRSTIVLARRLLLEDMGDPRAIMAREVA